MYKTKIQVRICVQCFNFCPVYNIFILFIMLYECTLMITYICYNCIMGLGSECDEHNTLSTFC